MEITEEIKEQFESWLRASKLATNTIDLYLSYINKIRYFDNGIMYLLQNSSKVGYFAVKKFAKFLLITERIDYKTMNLFDSIAPKSHRKNFVDYINREDIDKLLASEKCREDIALLIRLLFSTGLRISTALNFRLSQVEPYTKFLNIRTKGFVQVRVPISKRLYKDLVEYAARNKIQPSQRIFPYTRRNYAKLLAKLGKQVLGRRIHPHQFRHSFGVYYYAMTKDISATQIAMGHSDPKTTMIYTRRKPIEYERTFKKYAEAVDDDSNTDDD